MKEENLIFIVSQPRAGSTYLQNLLSNNLETNTCSEPWVLLNYLSTIKPSLVRTKTDNKLAIGALNNYFNKFSSLDNNIVFKEFLLKLYKPLFKDYTFAIDKTPRYWEILDELIALFPKSKVIIIHRNPISVAQSLIKTWNFSSMQELNLFRRDLLYAPKKLYDFCSKQNDNPNVYDIYYEELINDPALEIKKLYTWCGIKYNTAVLDVSTNKKYKGVYGDPFQNTNEDYSVARKKSKDIILSKDFRNFLSGYFNYLGKDFLKQYGDYHINEISIKKTMAFNYFLHLGEDEHRSFSFKKNNINRMLKDYIYKLKFDR